MGYFYAYDILAIWRGLTFRAYIVMVYASHTLKWFGQRVMWVSRYSYIHANVQLNYLTI